MNKIKIAGILIFLISITLVVVSKNIIDHTKINNNLLETINKQKAFTQEISKNIFYIYRNKNASTKQLDDSIKEFLKNMENRENILEIITSPKIKLQSKKILILWNKFYLDVQKFRDNSKIDTPYTKIILENIVKTVYSDNLNLIVEFDILISLHGEHFNKEHSFHKFIQYSLFAMLILVLIYFLIYISRTSNNIDVLMKRIDDSIKSIDNIENSAEDILDDIELTKDEDIIIEALDELMISSNKLKKLKIDLENLTKLKKT
ncbi:MAG: hypothetical protein U9N59_13955 [Campylobacterota bacterium]|nr:hypothetical protein [Campylobacterota bacterium]